LQSYYDATRDGFTDLGKRLELPELEYSFLAAQDYKPFPAG
jgi:hypothetical protein